MTVKECINRYHYKPLPVNISLKQRKLYLSEIPPAWQLNGDINCKIYDLDYNLLANSYSRIVIGDYGAYVEFTPEQIVSKDLIIRPGEEYRFEIGFESIKYHWYCLRQNYNIKIYYQKRTVPYADYKPGFYYISPSELRLIK